MTAYYNENDPKAAAWLRELIKEGHVAQGIVDDRSIEDITPSDLEGFTQCHFFAGIGGWSYALRLAGWPDDRPVWTGSCPCQPFSAAGKGAGFADERHLWPSWLWLARQRRPGIIFGEQVASAMQWIDLVQGDLEAEGYACGYAVLGAHSVGAPHIRQRLYWVADTSSERRQQVGGGASRHEGEDGRQPYADNKLASHGADSELAFTESEQHDRSGDSRGRRGEPTDGGELGDTDAQRLEQHAQRDSEAVVRTIASSFWADVGGPSYIDCRDGKRRPVEPGTFPLASGVPGRMVLLRGYGNSIVPQVAAAFIRAYLG